MDGKKRADGTVRRVTPGAGTGSSSEAPGETLRMEVMDIRIEPADGERFRQVMFVTSRGDVACHYYPPAGDEVGVEGVRRSRANAAVVWLAGAVGGFKSPAKNLYARLAGRLAEEGIASLRVAYRRSTVLAEATLDALLGLTFLRQEGFERLGVVGHSFGGAVALNAAAGDARVALKVRAVVTLATQSLGGEAVKRVGKQCALMMLHGGADELLPVGCSRYVYGMATCAKELHVVEGARHFLDEGAEEVEGRVYSFLRGRLGRQ